MIQWKIKIFSGLKGKVVRIEVMFWYEKNMDEFS